MAQQCVDDDGKLIVAISTDDPEDTDHKLYGDWDYEGAGEITWEPTEYQQIHWYLPTVNVSLPIVNVSKPTIRVLVPVICLTVRPQ